MLMIRVDEENIDEKNKSMGNSLPKQGEPSRPELKDAIVITSDIRKTEAF